MKKALLFKKLENKLVQCLACRHRCQIKPNKTGLCGVRKNIHGELFLLVYGQAAAAHVDPIEKKPLYHFLPRANAFSIGTLGCNFGCLFCQNWDISQATKTMSASQTEQAQISSLEEYGQNLPPEEIVKYAKKNKIPIIAYTYNEPTIFVEYAYDTAKLANQNKIKNVFVSNGYESDESLELMSPYLDALNIDLKSFSDDFYKKTCKARLQPVLKTIKKVKQLGIWQEITTLLIPGMNDSEKELKELTKFIVSVDADIPWHISAFHPDYKMTEAAETPHETLLNAYELGKKAGLKFIYAGNVYDPVHSTTFCPNCGEKLIERAGFKAKILNFKHGICLKCKEKIPGVWS